MNKVKTIISNLDLKWKILLSVIVGIVIGIVLHWALSPAVSMKPGDSAAMTRAEEKKETIWTCSMHPEIRLPNPGLCPKCGMELIPLVQDTGGEDVGDAVQFSTSDAAKALMDIETSPVERRFVTAEIRMVGKVEYDETKLAYITAWVPGRLDRLYVDYTGVPVKKGDHMVYMYSPELLSAQEELIQARKAVENIENSQSEIIRDVTAGTVEAVREKLRLLGLTAEQVAEIESRGTVSDHITIYAPVGGIVVHKNAQEGMYVSTGTRIYTVADLSHVWVKLDAYESDLSWLRYGQKVEFTTVSFPGQVFEGTIAFIDPVLNPMTRTVKVRVDVPNQSGVLKPEMFVKAVVKAEIALDGRVMDPALAGKWICPMHPSIIKEEPGPCDICEMPLVRTESLGYASAEPKKSDMPLVIPATAPLVTGKRAVVYVEVPDAEKPTYEGREIVLGPRAGDYYIVRSGLEEGQRVVTKGNFKIDSALQIQAKPSMMMPRQESNAVEHQHEGMSQSKGMPSLKLSEMSRSQIQAVFNVYFSIQQKLAGDDLKAASEELNALKDAIEKVDMKILSEQAHIAWMKYHKSLKDIVSQAVKGEDIEAFRETFSLLSDELYAMALQFGTPGKTPIYQLKCPMAFNNRGATWLQTYKDVYNPYFGEAMLKCGSVLNAIEPDDSTEDAVTGGQQYD